MHVVLDQAVLGGSGRGFVLVLTLCLLGAFGVVLGRGGAGLAAAGVTHAARGLGLGQAYRPPGLAGGGILGHQEIAAGLGVQRPAADPQIAAEGGILQVQAVAVLTDDGGEMGDLPVHDGWDGDGLARLALDQAVFQIGLVGQTRHLRQRDAALR